MRKGFIGKRVFGKGKGAVRKGFIGKGLVCFWLITDIRTIIK
jgi:hypothetical protein